MSGASTCWTAACPGYDVYQTADGKWMALGSLEPRFYAALLERLDLKDAPDRDDPQNWPRLRELFAAAVRPADPGRVDRVVRRQRGVR